MNGKEYIAALKSAYEKKGLGSEWQHLEQISHGISDGDKRRLLKKYPDLPSSLLEILETVDGTYYRKYGDEEVCLYFFGSDVEDGEYPYYLFSVDDILNERNSRSDFDDLIDLADEEGAEECGLFADERLRRNGENIKWLSFSDCMNNGGSSVLFIDFTPSEKGVKGQVVRFLHDPDDLSVIAGSFDEFLDMQAETSFRFIHGD